MTKPNEHEVKKPELLNMFHEHEIEQASITSFPKDFPPAAGDLAPMSPKAAWAKPKHAERRVTLMGDKPKPTDDMSRTPQGNSINVNDAHRGITNTPPIYVEGKKYGMILDFKALNGNPSTGDSPTHWLCAVGSVAVEVFRDGNIFTALLRPFPYQDVKPLLQVWGPNPHAAVKGLVALPHWALDSEGQKWKLFDASDKKRSLQSSLCILGLGLKNPTPPKDSLRPFAYLPLKGGKWIWEYQDESKWLTVSHKPRMIPREKTEVAYE